MTDRGQLADRLEARAKAYGQIGVEGGNDGYYSAANAADDLEAAAALRQEPSVDAAFRRQTDNLAFILNRVDLPPAWFEKFDRELAEDRQAIAALYRGET